MRLLSCGSLTVTLVFFTMVGTPPYQKRRKSGHWMPSFDKHLRCYSCRMHCKGEDPCASGAPLEACSACSSFMEVEWNHLRTVFKERSAKHAGKIHLVELEPDSEGEPEPEFQHQPVSLLHNRLQVQVEYKLFCSLLCQGLHHSRLPRL